MARILFIFVAILLAAQNANAQSVEITTNKLTQNVQDNQLVADLEFDIMVTDMKATHAVVVTPVLSNGILEKALPSILVNGSIRHRLYARTSTLNERNGIPNEYKYEAVFYTKRKSSRVKYSPSVAYEDWMSGADVSYRYSILDANDNVLASNFTNKDEETKPIAETKPTVVPDAFTPAVAPQMSAEQAAIMNATEQMRPTKLIFQGAYIAPVSDDRDKRNKQVYNFKIEEARVMADISPETLSLYELYQVAQSYRSDMKKFYSIIEISAKLFPSDPVANMNAAAAAIDQNNLQAAAKYLQTASHDNDQYRNNRGVYEILSGNIPEGILNLKQAQKNGSEEASKNLKAFFSFYRR